MNTFYDEAGEKFMHAFVGQDITNMYHQQAFLSWREKRREKVRLFLRDKKRRIAGWWLFEEFATNIDIYYLSLINKDLSIKEIIEKIAHSSAIADWGSCFPDEENIENAQNFFLSIHWLELSKARKIDKDLLKKKKLYKARIPKIVETIEEKRQRNKWN